MPKALISNLDKNHKRWLPASLRALGLKVNLDQIQEVTGYQTPFPVRRDVLLGTLDCLENEYCSIESAFGLRSRNYMFWKIFNYTEFMLINAYCLKKENSLKSFFEPGLTNILYSAATTDPDYFCEEINRIPSPHHTVINLHPSLVARMESCHLSVIFRMLTRIGLVSSKEEFMKNFENIKKLNRGRGKKAAARIKG